MMLEFGSVAKFRDMGGINEQYIGPMMRVNMEFSSSSSAAACDASTVSRRERDRKAVVNRCEKTSGVDASCVVVAGQAGEYSRRVKRPQSAVELADAEFRKHSNESRNTSSLPPLTPSEILNWQLTDRTCSDDGLRRFGRSRPRRMTARASFSHVLSVHSRCVTEPQR